MFKILIFNCIISALSIHTTRGFSGYTTSTCMYGSPYRFLGPSVRVAIPLTVLWGSACSFLAVVMIKSISTLNYLRQVDNRPCDLFVLAITEFSLALLTLSIVLVHLRIDCKHDPDWSPPSADGHGAAIGVSVIGGVSGFGAPTSAVSDKPTKVAWMV